jgi:uridine monophosphate synthetase
LARVRREAPERFLILRSLWAEEDRLVALLEAGLSDSADGLLLPLPQNLLVEADIAARAAALKGRIGEQREQWLQRRARSRQDSCQLWLPQPTTPTGPGRKVAENREASLGQEVDAEPHAELIVDLFDIGCLLFGEYVQASGDIFNYYIDLRQIISDPNLFHRVLHAYSLAMAELAFDRIAGIPYGSLPTATGLSLLLHKPLIYPRKEVKAHGARRLIEGDFEDGDLVVVVDDVLITGGSVLEGIAKLESSGLQVQDVVVFIDHGGATDRRARQRLETGGYRLHAVLDIERITRILHGAGRLDDAQVSLLEHRGNQGTVAVPGRP